MKEQLEAVIADLERALENTSDQDNAIVSNIEAPGLMRGAIQKLKDIITDGARFTPEGGKNQDEATQIAATEANQA